MLVALSQLQLQCWVSLINCGGALREGYINEVDIEKVFIL